MTTEPCPRIADLLVLAGRPGDDPAQGPLWDHATACPRCRGLLAAYDAFTRAAPSADRAPGEEKVVARLRGVLEERIRRAGVDTVEPARRYTPRPRAAWLRLLLPACGATAIVLALFLWMRDEPTPGRYRAALRAEPGDEGRASLLALPVRPLPDGRIEMIWHRLPAADAYRVRILDLGLRTLQVLPAGSDTSMVLDPSHLAGEGPAVYWQVEALRSGDRIGDSVPARLNAPRTR